MRGPPLDPGGEDITWPDPLAPRGQKALGTPKVKPQSSNLNIITWCPFCDIGHVIFRCGCT